MKTVVAVMKLEELLDVPALVLSAHSFPPVTRLLSGTFALGVPLAALGLRLGGWLSWHRRFQHVAGFLRSSEGDFAEPFFVFCSAVFCEAGWEKGWPYDILSINITGAFFLALVTTLADATLLVGPMRCLFINVGLLGAYTTFSTLALGDVLLMTNGSWLSALLYLILSGLGGVVAVFLGDLLGQ